MSGENLGLNTYYSPFTNYGLQNDDFMANLHFSQIAKTGEIPGAVNTANEDVLLRNPEKDTFEKSGNVGLGEGILLTAAGTGAGAAAGAFFLSNPIKDVKQQTLNSDFYKTMDKSELAKIIKTEQESLRGRLEYNLAQFVKAKSFEELPEDVQTFLKNRNFEKKTPDDAKEHLKKLDFDNDRFDLNKVAQNLTEEYKGTEYYNKIIKTCEDNGILASVDKAATKEELKDLIVKNKEFFGISGTEAEIAQKAETLAAKGKNGVSTEAEKIINTAKDFLTERQKAIFKNVDSNGKLTANAEESVKTLFKDFKWQQAKKYGKWGAVIAASAAVLYSMFGGSKKSK